MSTIFAKALEHWLTSTGERGYQPAFVYGLIGRGDVVLYSARHRPLEQGKDVVARDVAGALHAYQLKSGTLGVAEWKEHFEQLVQLVSMPVRQAAPGEAFVAHWVTNGNVADEVNVFVNEFNSGNDAAGRGWARLEIIQREQLLRLLLDVADTLPPMEPEVVQQLFNTYGASGQGMLDREAVYDLLWNVSFERAGDTPAAVRNAVAGCVLVAAFATKPYQAVGNHVAMFEAWILLAAAVSRFDARREGRDRRLVLETLGIAWDECDAALDRLFDEAVGRENLLEGGWIGDGADVYRARATYVLGLVAAREVVRKRLDPEYVLDDRAQKLVRDYNQYLWLWGESAVPYFYAIVRLLELHGASNDARLLMATIWAVIVDANHEGANGETALPNPYYSAEDVLHDELESDPVRRRIDRREFVRQSACLESGVFLMARRGMRAELTLMWGELSRMRRSGFVAADPEAFWSYRSENGRNRGSDFPIRQSWKELVEEAEAATPSLHVWPLWGIRALWALMVMPHRWHAGIACLVDGAPHRPIDAPSKGQRKKPDPVRTRTRKTAGARQAATPKQESRKAAATGTGKRTPKVTKSRGNKKR